MILENEIIKENPSFFKRFLFLVLLLFMGKGCNFFIDLDPRVNIIGTTLVVVPMILVMLREKPHYTVDRRFFIFITVYILWFIYHVFTDEVYPTYHGFRILSLIIFGFLTVKYYGYHIGEYYEYFVVRLTVLALIMWGLEIVIGPGNMALFAPFENRMHTGTVSFGFFSLGRTFDASNYFLGLPRNHGFCWEPGQFGSLLVLALTFYMLRTDSKFYRSYTFWILTIGLLSTMSTTGFVTFGVLLMLKMVFGKVSTGRRIVYFLLLLVLFMYAMDLPFISEKIADLSNEDDFLTNSTNVYINETGHRTVQRFEGMTLSWMNLMDSPWLGYGPNMNNSLVSRTFPMFIISNGNLDPLAMFGILFGLPLFLLLYKGTCLISNRIGNENKYILFVVIMLISVSYNYLLDSIILSLTFLTFLKENNTRYE